MRLTGKEMAKVTQGNWSFGLPEVILGIGTDSRDFVEGYAFLALRGVSFDGHEHANQVVQQASALIGDAKGVQQWRNLEKPQLEVADTLRALGDLATCHRKSLPNTRVIAITGSYGKTTVRSMLSHVLTTLGLEVAATKENFNNLIGVPKTLMAIEATADVAIIECGISERGEMERLSEIVQPDIAVVTGVTHAHGEGLGGIVGVAKEKAKLMTHLLPQGWCVLGSAVVKQFAKAGYSATHTTYNMDDEAVVSWHLSGKTLSLKQFDESYDLALSLPAKHWAEDMALTAEVALRLAKDLSKDWSLEDVTKALQTWQAVDGRMRVFTIQGQFTLIDDSYNANPVSMQAALDTLSNLKGYRVAIIGDMLELGDDAVAMHQQLDLHGIDEVLTVGELMGTLQAKNPRCHVRVFRHVEALAAWLEGKSFPPLHSTVLVKSSHGTGLHSIVTKLKQRGQYVI